jgi:hypothetical protein
MLKMTNIDYEKEIFELKQIMLEVREDVKIIKPLLKMKISLIDFTREIGINSATLHAYIKANYEPEVDFYKINNRILLNVNILQSIRGHYAK